MCANCIEVFIFCPYRTIRCSVDSKETSWPGLPPKWNGACDKGFASFISNIYCTFGHRQSCVAGSTVSESKLGLRQAAHFAEYQTHNPDMVESYLCLVLTCWFQFHEHAKSKLLCLVVAQEQTCLSPGAGLRVEGLSALSLWDFVLVFLELSHLSAQLRAKI